MQSDTTVEETSQKDAVKQSAISSRKGKIMSASKAAAIIRILSARRDRDPRFVKWVTEKISRGKD